MISALRFHEGYEKKEEAYTTVCGIRSTVSYAERERGDEAEYASRGTKKPARTNAEQIEEEECGMEV